MQVRLTTSDDYRAVVSDLFDVTISERQLTEEQIAAENARIEMIREAEAER